MYIERRTEMRTFKTYEALKAEIDKLLAQGKQICNYREANKYDGFVGWILFL